MTGYFGPLTRGAILRLQAREGLAQTGVIDTSTRTALLALPSAVSLTEKPPTGVVGPFSNDLFFGMRGDAVIALQTFLAKEHYLASSNITGYFGRLTRAAVAAFQQEHSIVPTAGYAGPITRAKIIENIASSTAQ